MDTSYSIGRYGIKFTNKELRLNVGIRNDRIREIQGARIAEFKDKLNLKDLFSDLKERIIRRVDLVISDALPIFLNMSKRN